MDTEFDHVPVQSKRATRFAQLFSSPLFWLIGLNLAVTLPLSYILNIWMDEAYTLNTLSKSWQFAISQAIHFELQPPLYFALVYPLYHWTDSIFVARLFSVVSISLTIYVAWLLCQRYIPSLYPGWLVAAIVLNPYPIWAALEIRVYAFGILLSALLLLFFFDAFLAESIRPSACWKYSIAAIVSIYTNYFLIGILIAHAVTLVLLRRWRNLADFCWVMAIVGVCSIPMLVILQQHLAINAEVVYGSDSISLLAVMKDLLRKGWDYLFPMTAAWFPARLIRYGTLILPMVTAAMLLYKCRAVTRSDAAIWLTTLAAGTVLLLVFATTNATAIYRYAYPLYLPTVMSAFAFLSLMQPPQRVKLLLSWTLIALIFCFYTLVMQYHPLAKAEDWKGAAAYLMQSEQPNQPILVFRSIAALPLSYYYKGENQLIPIPRELGEEVYDLRRIVLKDQSEILQALGNPTEKPEHLWLVNNCIDATSKLPDIYCDSEGLKLNYQILDNFINAYYRVEFSRMFYGNVQVSLLHREE